MTSKVLLLFQVSNFFKTDETVYLLKKKIHDYKCIDFFYTKKKQQWLLKNNNTAFITLINIIKKLSTSTLLYCIESDSIKEEQLLNHVALLQQLLNEMYNLDVVKKNNILFIGWVINNTFLTNEQCNILLFKMQQQHPHSQIYSNVSIIYNYMYSYLYKRIYDLINITNYSNILHTITSINKLYYI